MPHSPRLYRGRLWLHNSGTGQFGSVEPGGGPFEPLARGFTDEPHLGWHGGRSSPYCRGNISPMTVSPTPAGPACQPPRHLPGGRRRGRLPAGRHAERSEVNVLVIVIPPGDRPQRSGRHDVRGPGPAGRHARCSSPFRPSNSLASVFSPNGWEGLRVGDYRLALLYAGFLFLPAAGAAWFLPEMTGEKSATPAEKGKDESCS